MNLKTLMPFVCIVMVGVVAALPYSDQSGPNDNYDINKSDRYYGFKRKNKESTRKTAFVNRKNLPSKQEAKSLSVDNVSHLKLKEPSESAKLNSKASHISHTSHPNVKRLNSKGKYSAYSGKDDERLTRNSWPLSSRWPRRQVLAYGERQSSAGNSVNRVNRDVSEDKECEQILRDVIFPPKEVRVRCAKVGTRMPRMLGRKGKNGVFGFFINRHFFHCKPPEDRDIVTNRSANGESMAYIPVETDYYYKCQYYDEDPTRKDARRIGSKGENGTFGYYERGEFVACDPPKRVEQVFIFDAKLNASALVYIIPYEISLEYPSKCEYFDDNPGNKYNYNDTLSGGQSRLMSYNKLNSVVSVVLVLLANRAFSKNGVSYF